MCTVFSLTVCTLDFKDTLVITAVIYIHYFLENGESEPAQLSLEFRVFLVSAQTGKHTQESRILRYWFRTVPGNPNQVDDTEQAAVAQEFFRELVSPQEFPRGKNDYFCWHKLN